MIVHILQSVTYSSLRFWLNSDFTCLFYLIDIHNMESQKVEGQATTNPTETVKICFIWPFFVLENTVRFLHLLRNPM